MSYFSGLDWASAEHAVCVIDEKGSIQAQFSVSHSAAGMSELRQRLRRFGEPAEVQVAIERPSGPATDLLERLRDAPPSLVGDAESETKGELVRSIVAVLEPLVCQIQRLTAALEHAVEQHPDGAIVMSLPRSGRVNAAQILAELGDDRTRFASDDQLAAEAGVAPVTYASGKHRGVAFRWACNKRLRGAVTCFADNSRHSSSWAAATYTRARGRGCDHPHAIRILARAWLRVLWRCWQDRTRYDLALHRAARLVPA